MAVDRSNQKKISFEELISNHGMASILAVDDNQKNIQVIGQLLKHATWCSLSVCLESQKAIKLAAKIRPDIILLDLHMPKLNGIDVLKKLNEMEILETSTVIFLTADREIENRLEGLSLGCADYIQKPFNSDEFIIKLKYHIKMRYYEKEILNTLKNTNNLLDNINQAIFSINKNGEIINPISNHSKEIFGSNIEPGIHINSFLQGKFQFSEEEIRSFLEQLLSSFKQSKINWTEIERSFPKKFLLTRSREKIKILKINYSSVWNGEQLENIIFYFNDITDKEKVEDESTKYSLSQISSLSSINLETLRSWTKRFHIKGDFSHEESKFRFSGKELKKFQLYKELIEKGENIGALVKLSYKELIKRKNFLTEEKSRPIKMNESSIKSYDLVNTLHFFMTQKKFDIFQRDFNKLPTIYNQRELVFDIILPFLKLRNKDRFWNNFSDAKKDFLNFYLIKKIIEFAVPKKSIPINEVKKIFLLDFFPSNTSLTCPILLLLASYHNFETYYIKENILNPSFLKILKEEKDSIIFLNLDKKGSFDETEFNAINKDILNSSALKKAEVILFNNHPTIKIDNEKNLHLNVINSFEDVDQFFIDLSNEKAKIKSAA